MCFPVSVEARDLTEFLLADVAMEGLLFGVRPLMDNQVSLMGEERYEDREKTDRLTDRDRQRERKPLPCAESLVRSVSTERVGRRNASADGLSGFEQR